MPNEDVTIDSDTTAEIDAQYVPFPSFQDWTAEHRAFPGWVSARTDFQEVAPLASQEDLREAQDIAMRAAAFDTGAIEGLYPTDRGLTLTVATQSAAWESEVVDKSGADAIALFDAQLEAFEQVMDLATTSMPEISEAWIRRLHEVVTGPQFDYTVHTAAGPQKQKLPKGEYKGYPNHVKTDAGDIHAYAPVEMTGPEMQRLVTELNSDDFTQAHPVLQASYAHYALVAIHPFADGNGRVSRAVASVYTYRSDSVPLLILEDQRQRYFAALAEADRGETDRFVSFIARASQDALHMVTATIEAAKAPNPDKFLNRFRSLYLAQGSLSHTQLDTLANQVVDEFVGIAQEELDARPLPDGLSAPITPGQWEQGTIPLGYRAVVSPGSRYVQMDLSSRAPAAAHARTMIEFFVSAGRDTTDTLVFADDDPETVRPLILGLEDIYPTLTTASRHRLRAYIRRLFGASLARLLTTAEEAMAKSGYTRQG